MILEIPGKAMAPLAPPLAQALYITVPWLDFSIDGCRIRPLAGKIRKKSLNVVLGLKIDGCMHPWPQIDRCSCAPRTRTNQDGLQIGSLYAYGQNLTLHGQVKK